VHSPVTCGQNDPKVQHTSSMLLFFKEKLTRLMMTRMTPLFFINRTHEQFDNFPSSVTVSILRSELIKNQANIPSY